jgi:hypothetical protein
MIEHHAIAKLRARANILPLNIAQNEEIAIIKL